MMELTTVQRQQLRPITEGVWIYRIPQPVYQMFFDMIPRITSYRDDTWLQEQTKARILKELNTFISEHFPGMVIVNMEDLNKEQAAAIHPNLQWGMYVQLAEGSYVGGTMEIGNALNQLEYDK